MTNMNPLTVSNKTKVQYGVAIPEYSILLGLVAVLAVGGLTVLGDATKSLFTHSDGLVSSARDILGGPSDASSLQLTADSSAATPVAHVVDSASVQKMPGQGYYNLVLDPATGQPALRLVKGSSGVNINVNSVDGSRYNVLGTIMLANKLDQMAAQQSDPALKDYYAKLSKYSYYLGGAEGVMDNVQQVAWSNVTKGQWDPKTGVYQTYTLGDGLRDVFSYRQELQGLLANPPGNINTQELRQVMPYVTDAVNIAQKYINTFHDFIRPDGQVPQNFGGASECTSQNQATGALGGCGLGGQVPGAAIAAVSNAVLTPPGAHEMIGISYDALVPLSQLKINANILLSDQSVANIPVVATFTDAKTTDTHTQ